MLAALLPKLVVILLKYMAIILKLLAHGENEQPIKDISSTGHVGSWTSNQFITAFRTGKTPEGKSLSSAMPRKLFGQACTERELAALYEYLHGLK